MGDIGVPSPTPPKKKKGFIVLHDGIVPIDEVLPLVVDVSDSVLVRSRHCLVAAQTWTIILVLDKEAEDPRSR